MCWTEPPAVTNRGPTPHPTRGSEYLSDACFHSVLRPRAARDCKKGWAALRSRAPPLPHSHTESCSPALRRWKGNPEHWWFLLDPASEGALRPGVSEWKSSRVHLPDFLLARQSRSDFLRFCSGHNETQTHPVDMYPVSQWIIVMNIARNYQNPHTGFEPLM